MQKEKEGILLESGTNEIEIMKFTVLGEFYGINVAKVREIIMSEKVKPMPHAHPAVEGIFKPRESLITVINLAYYLSGTRPENGARDLFIVTNFNKMTVAFRESAAFPGRTYRSRIRPLPMGMKALLPALPSVRASWSPSWILRKLLRR